LTYYAAHAVAEAIECDAVEADGYSLAEYTAFWNQWEKHETDEKEWYGVPADLYMEPYVQCRDKKTMKNMHVGVLDRLKEKARRFQSSVI